MTKFELKSDTKIYFGTGITEQALKAERKRFGGKTMVVTTGGSLAANGHLDRIKDILEQIAGKEKVLLYDAVSRNPRLSEVKRAADIAKREKVRTIVGFGGGSALDAAKAAAAGAAGDNDLERCLLDGLEPSQETLPIIAIPTTAGTGSELSRAAIISSPEHHIKAGIRGRHITPKVAVVDPVYTWTVPVRITMETGFDVLAHAIESYIAVKANLFSEMLSERAVRYAGENLRILCQNIDCHEAREKMSYASMIRGWNLANVGTCLPHRLQYPVGAATDTGHAAGLIALYPSWIEQEYEVSAHKINEVFGWLKLQEADTASQAAEIFREFLRELGIFRTLAGLGVGEHQIKTLAEEVRGALSNDPLAERPDVVRIVYQNAFQEE